MLHNGHEDDDQTENHSSQTLSISSFSHSSDNNAAAAVAVVAVASVAAVVADTVAAKIQKRQKIVFWAKIFVWSFWVWRIE